MGNIKARVESLEKMVRALHPECTTPYEELDPISQSVMDLVHELEALDTAGRRADYCERHSLDADGLEAFIRAVAVDW